MIYASGLLSGHAYFLHWGVVQISLANLVVVALMLVLFLLALLLPFPHGSSSASTPLPVEPRAASDVDR